MVDFATMRKNRGASSLEKLKAEAAKLNPSPQYADDDANFWRPATDKAGNGEAIIRFLPAKEGEEVPFVRIWNHGFKGPTGTWYIENSLTTLGQTDPVSEYNSVLWNSGDEKDKEQARIQKRKLTFISNVYVIKDKLNPENEGKVFKFRYGKKIFDKLNTLMNPEFEGDEPINPFDLWEGANFRVRIKQVAGYRNYDESRFDDKSPLFKDEDKMEEIWSKAHSLASHVAPDQFKSYEELKTRLYRVLALDKATPLQGSASAATKKSAAAVQQPDVEDDDDEDLSAFKKMMTSED